MGDSISARVDSSVNTVKTDMLQLDMGATETDSVPRPTETASPSERRSSNCARVPPVRYGIDEYANHAANLVGADIDEPQNIKEAQNSIQAKYTCTGEIEQFKGRLVTRGFAQEYGIDYNETFSPVVRFPSIRTLIAHGLNRNMKIHQMDVVTAFLNGSLEEEIYMTQPEGFVQPGNENLVCRLRKSLYGLKQSPRCWNKILHDYLVSLFFTQSKAVYI